MDFKLEENVPEIYTEESRDFQLLCRIIDIYIKGCMNRAYNMIYQMDINNCNESLLYAIADMEGFTTSMYIPPDVLRNILKVFPWCIKRKGTEEAIRVAAYSVMATYKYIYNVSVEITNMDGEYIVRVSLAGKDTYIDYIYEVLRFLVPAGYNLRVYNVQTYKNEVTDRVTIEDYVARVSGVSGVILGNHLAATFAPNKESETNQGLGFYSRIGYAKIIRARSTTELLEERFGGANNPASNISLIHVDENNIGIPRYIYGKVDAENLDDDPKAE